MKEESRWRHFRKGTHARVLENMHQHEPWELWLDAVVGTVLTLFFTWLAIHSSFTGNLFNTLADVDSSELIDLYTSSSHRTGVPKYSNITVMPTDGCSRQEVTTALELLSEMESQAIGLDVTFPYYADGDEMLMEAIMSNGNLVMATCPSPNTYFESILREEGVTFGSVVLDVNSRHDIVRSFAPATYTKTDTTWSFEIQLARMAGANVAKFYPYDEHAYILYSNLMIDTLSCKTLINPQADLTSIAEQLKGQIILIGDVNNPMDQFRTPVDADMPGVMVHAYALDTLLRGQTIEVSPNWVIWLTTFVVCVFFAFFILFCKWGLDDAEGLALRLTQLLLMLLVVAIPGVLLFHLCHLYFNFTTTFVALAIQAFIIDIWVGIVAIAKHLRRMRVSILAICLIIAASATAQRPNGLYVHSVKGPVLYRPQTTNDQSPITNSYWSTPAAKQTLSRLDSLEVKDKGEVVLVDGANDNVYRCATPMRDNVLHFVQAARDKANVLLRSLAKQLIRNVMGRGAGKYNYQSPMTNHQSPGPLPIAAMTTRAADDDKSLDSIACLALQTAKRFQAGQRILYDEGLHWLAVEEDGFVHFIITNHTEEAYCANILMMNRETGHVALRIVPSPDVDARVMVVPAGERMDLDMYRFLPNEALEYTLFATTVAYTPAAVQALLKYP